MNATLAQLKVRLSGRSDSEHGQALVRLVLFAGVMVYMILGAATGNLDPVVSTTASSMSMLGFGVGLALFCWILYSPGTSHTRRIIGMCTDYGLMSTAMALMGEPLAWLYVIMMWVTVGNGLRYGNRYLLGAVAMAAAAFSAVLATNAYWADNLSLGIGLLIGLVAVPMYLSGLLRQLTRATAEAHRANEAKSRFLANMSHEFRTPLNGLSGMSELLATTRLDSEQRECLTTIQASTRSMLALVEDVLDISAIEAGKLKLELVDFEPRELVESIGMILLPQARAKSLRYEVHVADDVPQRLRGDVRHLRQVLLNLAGNAVKFTDAGAVRLEVLAVASDDMHPSLRFTVSDTGVGIPEAVRERLFDAFEQADVSMSRRYGGTGLGTTIAKGLTEAMGGTIGFESVEQGGSSFWVTLPFLAVQAPPAVEQNVIPAWVEEAEQGSGENVIAFADPFLRHRARVRSLQILVADDHEANRMVVQRLLQKAGHRVVCVNGGEAALDAMEASEYDAVIVDLHMPGLSGLDLLKHLRVMQAGGPLRTPVMVLSADVTPESMSRCEQAGARAFLAKPIMATRLLDLLSEIASKGSLDPASSTVSGVPRPVAVSGTDPVLDPGVLDELQSLGMGESFERQFIAQCMSDARDCILALSQALERGDSVQMREHAHALKGVSSNLGLVALAVSSGEMMRLPEVQITRDWRRRVSDLNARLEDGRLALEARDHARRHSRGKGELN